MNMDDIIKLAPKDMSEKVKKSSEIHIKSMCMVKEIFKNVLEYSGATGYLMFVAMVEQLCSGTLDAVSEVMPEVVEIRRIVRLSESECIDEISEKLDLGDHNDT